MIDREKVIDYLKWAIAEAELTGHTSITLEPLKDALSLLKEQEPQVLTLEDVRSDHDRVLWIECDDSKTQNVGQYRGQICWHDGHIGKWERFEVMGFASDYLYRDTEKYGKTWRCWNARPTEEQMRDTKWEEK